MNEQQAEKIVECLQSMNSKLDNIQKTIKETNNQVKHEVVEKLEDVRYEIIENTKSFSKSVKKLEG